MNVYSCTFAGLTWRYVFMIAALHPENCRGSRETKQTNKKANDLVIQLPLNILIICSTMDFFL